MRIEKIAILNEVVERIKDSDYCFILNHGGASVAKLAKLRVDLRKLGRERKGISKGRTA